MRVLLIGCETSLGLALEQHLRRWGRHELEAISASASRWKSERHAKKVVRRTRPEIIVDARIQGALDSGERIRDIDVDRCHWLAKACQKNTAVYCYISSARVFSGAQKRRYTEQDTIDGDSSLGRLLGRAEGLVRAGCERHLVLRLGPVFAHGGVNVLTRMLGQLMQGGTLELDNRQRGGPVEATDAARVVAGILDQLGTGAELWGDYHYCSADTTNCYEFAEVLLACASQFSEFGPGAVQLQASSDAAAHSNWSLDCNRLRNTFAIKQVPWRGFVADAVRLYFMNQPAAE